MPTLRAPNVAAAYLYYDAQTDDARYTLTLARTAANHGAVLANHTAVTKLRKGGDGRVNGATVGADGRTFDISAHTVVNAAGVFSDEVRALDEGTHPHSIRPAKGIHITVPWEKVRNDIAAIVPVPKDRRSIFVVPWGDFTYIGTTDTDYDGPIDDPQCTPEDVKYLLDAMNMAMADPLTEADVIGTWAGLRPLVTGGTVGQKTADLSRRHKVTASKAGLVTVTGGKLTTYRRMAADAVDAAVGRLGIRGRRSRTRRIRLHGAAGWDATGLPRDLATRYGGDAHEVLALCRDDASLAEPIVSGLAYTKAEVVYAARAEMARTVDDVLSRRTRARLLARDASAAAAADVADLMAAELGWSDTERDRQVEEYRALIDAERSTGGLPETALDALAQPPS
jgi:glycerol-3-phosphate dehydrogenase